MTFLSVVKRMAKGAVEPLFWIIVFFGAVTGTSYLIADLTGYDVKQVYMFVWLAYAVAVGLYWAYGWTKWSMEFEQRQIERELERNS